MRRRSADVRKRPSSEWNAGWAARDDGTPGRRMRISLRSRQCYGAVMATPRFRLASHTFDDDASSPALSNFNAALARRIGETARRRMFAAARRRDRAGDARITVRVDA
ncbi:hypothetical protein [Burkholderia vietnamiensis]|uniref:hypothetical protein n=2 Tax=Burkholderia vietnamiensis TaxID=60552 RepID=UPI001FC7D9F2|nr:hypothetical protein [Burkholderia vietnamiensis]